MDIKKNFGKRVKEIRTNLGLTQEQLAEQIGLSSKSLSQIELGNNFVSADALALICKALKVKPNVLFDFEYFEKSKSSIIDEIIEKIKNNPKKLKTIYKIINVLE